MNKLVSRMIGETADVPERTEVAPDSAPSVTGNNDARNPTVDQLLQLWQAGSHEAVALRVLDALDSYADFLELAHRIGHDGSLELGRAMDAFTAAEQSPHKYDDVPVDQLPSAQGGERPRPGSAHGAIGEHRS